MYQNELNIAIEAAIKAGEFLNKREQIHIDEEVDKDIKLSSDKKSEQIILDILAKTNIPILSEECGFKGNSNEFCWIVDPIDGTANYLKGLDELVCVSIALWKNNEPILGVVNQFKKNNVFFGIVGEGAFLNGKKIFPSSAQNTSQAILATGFPVKRSYTTDSLFTFIQQIQEFKKIRMLGSAALMATFVAYGKIDAYFEEEIMIWDVAAAMAIVKASGAEISFELLDNNKCICKCFSTKELMEDYNVKSL